MTHQELIHAIRHLLRHEPGPEGEPGPFAVINQKLDRITKHMVTKADLDAAIAQLKQDIAAAAKRAADALAALQAKIDAGEDFTTELADLQGAHSDLAAIAAAPAPTAAAAAGAGAEGANPHPFDEQSGTRIPAAPPENQDAATTPPAGGAS